MTNIKQAYESRLSTYKDSLNKYKKRIKITTNLRIAIAIIGISYTSFFYIKKLQSFGNIALIVALAIFTTLVIFHNKYIKEKNKAQALYDINDQALKRLKGEWKNFDISGKEFIDEDHEFSWDLDIFGVSSLFQWINTGNTHKGKEKLKNLLVQPVKSKTEILRRQEAIKELSSKLDWRQKFQSIGMEVGREIKNPDKLLQWSKEHNDFFLRKSIIYISRILPLITIVGSVMFFIVSKKFILIFLIPLILQMIMIVFGYKEIIKTLRGIHSYRKDIQVYEEMIRVFEREEFKSSYINQLKKMILKEEDGSFIKQIKRLEKTIDKISLRASQFYIIFNILTLWDFKCAIEVEKWKRDYGENIYYWLEVLGEMEALSSLSVIGFDHPKWIMPNINRELIIDGKDLGHPLLPDKTRVCNDISFGEDEKILLITGSNMSGKSTFLRTIGINLVLAYAGAPVCAKEFTCGIMNIYTSMRIKDNLEENVSSFYAELLRIKKIIDAVDRKENVVFLLDEIFRGTNSKDRHIGAKTLIRKLSDERALGLVSTHDLELAELEKEKKTYIRNYHFQEYYTDNKIHFDYHLYPGVSKTVNAIYLMKKVGIEIYEDADLS